MYILDIDILICINYYINIYQNINISEYQSKNIKLFVFNTISLLFVILFVFIPI
jgi:hypothetical protein